MKFGALFVSNIIVLIVEQLNIIAITVVIESLKTTVY
jgi:hypothetical protein